MANINKPVSKMSEDEVIAYANKLNNEQKHTRQTVGEMNKRLEKLGSGVSYMLLDGGMVLPLRLSTPPIAPGTRRTRELFPGPPA